MPRRRVPPVQTPRPDPVSETRHPGIASPDGEPYRNASSGRKRPGSPGKSQPMVSAAVRTLAILETLGEVNAMGLEALARKVKLAKPTLHRFLFTLQELGYVRREPDERWAVTLKMFSAGSRALDHVDLLSASRQIAESLATELGETVHMGVLDGDSAVYVLKIESRYTIRMYSRVGRRMPLYCTAIGKILLAYLPAEETAALLDAARLVAFTPRTISTRACLDTELAEIRKAGFARDDEEHEEGIRCIAAPVFDYTGSVVAAISASWPRFRFDPARESEWAGKVRAAAFAISSILGANHSGEVRL